MPGTSRRGKPRLYGGLMGLHPRYCGNLLSPARCDNVTLSSHPGPTISGSSFVAFLARPARRWCDLKDTLDPIPAEPSTDQESFANRKLIRPPLNRPDHGHNNHGHNHASAERRDRERDGARDRDPWPGSFRRRARQENLRPPSRPTPRIFIIRSRCRARLPWSSCCATVRKSTAISNGTTRICIKLNRNGAANLMIYKPAIKYMFKEGENGRR